jgi:hypothetical protein
MREKNKFYFEDFYDDGIIEYKRKYVNDWAELRDFVGLYDIDLVDNELTIINMPAYIKYKQAKTKIYATNYNVLRIMSGLGGLAHSN